MKKWMWSSTLAAIIGGIAALWTKASSFSAALFFVPFSLGPLFVNLALCFFLDRLISQKLLVASTAAYAAWFSYIYLYSFYWHLDPQSGIAFFFIGAYSLPVMLPLWIVSFLLRKVKSGPQNISTHQSTSEP